MKDEFKAAGMSALGTTLRVKPGADLPLSLLKEVLCRRLAEVEARGS